MITFMKEEGQVIGRGPRRGFQGIDNVLSLSSISSSETTSYDLYIFCVCVYFNIKENKIDLNIGTKS